MTVSEVFVQWKKRQFINDWKQMVSINACVVGFFHVKFAGKIVLAKQVHKL